MRTNGQHNTSSPQWPMHMRWDRQRSNPDLHRMAEEYGKCWNPTHWHRLTQGYYDGFEDARTEYKRRYDEELAATMNSLNPWTCFAKLDFPRSSRRSYSKGLSGAQRRR